MSHIFTTTEILSKNEVDLLIEAGDSIHPVEFKKTATPSVTASRHFHLIKKLGKKVGHRAVFCFVEKDIALSEDIIAIPIGYL